MTIVLAVAAALVAVLGPARTWEVIGGAVDLALSHSWSDTQEPRPAVPWKRVAHAGGMVAGLTYTNSLDALEVNYAAGHRVFEIDFERTTEGRLVALHDWEDTWRATRPYARREGRQDLSTFLSEPMSGGLRPMTWEIIADWLRAHPDTYLVTDAKEGNLAILATIAKNQDLVPRIVPQIYLFREYDRVREMGYPRVLLSLYQLEWGTWPVLRFVRSHAVAGLVCVPDRLRRGSLGLRARALGIPVFAHTVNDLREVAEIEALGATGVFTDSLTP